MRFHYKSGFTLTELLIALTILGVIATFTIPKVLQSTTSSRNKSVAKEVTSVISGAYETYKAVATPSAAFTPGILTTYMNFVKTDTATAPGAISGETALQTCAAGVPCLQMHNGALVQYATANSFGGTGTTNVVYFNMDPDGDDDTAGRASVVLFYNGKITTGANQGTVTTAGTSVSVQTTDPSWIQAWN